MAHSILFITLSLRDRVEGPRLIIHVLRPCMIIDSFPNGLHLYGGNLLFELSLPRRHGSGALTEAAHSKITYGRWRKYIPGIICFTIPGPCQDTPSPAPPNF